jgi:hypothetical protein
LKRDAVPRLGLAIQPLSEILLLALITARALSGFQIWIVTWNVNKLVKLGAIIVRFCRIVLVTIATFVYAIDDVLVALLAVV